MTMTQCMQQPGSLNLTALWYLPKLRPTKGPCSLLQHCTNLIKPPTLTQIHSSICVEVKAVARCTINSKRLMMVFLLENSLAKVAEVVRPALAWVPLHKGSFWGNLVQKLTCLQPFKFNFRKPERAKHTISAWTFHRKGGIDKRWQ